VGLLGILALAGIGGCDGDSWGSTRLIVINNSVDTVFVEVDEHADGDIDAHATLAPGTQVDWVLDAGWTVILVDGDWVEIFLDEEFDGVFEIADN
jgi:hypothetical protein